MEIKAPKVVIESTKWFDEARQLVRNYDFTLHKVVMAEPKEKCQFCGTRLVYVALIDGVPFFTTTETPLRKRIGCDCLERVLGDTWKDYHIMQEQLKDLKEIVAAQKRAAKYAVEYKSQIEYLSVLPEKLTGEWMRDWKLRFIFDMRDILMKGLKRVTPRMIEILDGHIKRDVIADYRRRLNADDFQIGTWTDKISSLMKMIEQVQGPKIHDAGQTDYNVVNSILNYMNFQKKLTAPQMELLNRKFNYYSNRLSA
jgi:hypothetical protein